MSKRPLLSLYYLHYPEPVPLAEVESIFSAAEYSVGIQGVFPGSFLLESDASYSEIKHSLTVFYLDGHAAPLRDLAIMKLKADSSPEIRKHPSLDPSAATALESPEAP